MSKTTKFVTSIIVWIQTFSATTLLKTSFGL